MSRSYHRKYGNLFIFIHINTYSRGFVISALNTRRLLLPNKISLFFQSGKVGNILRRRDGEKEATSSFAEDFAAAEIAVSFLLVRGRVRPLSQSAMVHIAKAKIMFIN